MSLIKANKLNSAKDILPRGVFRLVWCSVGCVIVVQACAVLKHSVPLVFLFLVTAAVPLAGMVVDTIRVKTR